MATESPQTGVALLHADGATCHHEGDAQSTVHDDGGPVCPGGEQITHVRYNGKLLTITEAYAALSSMAETITKAIAPMADAFAEFGRKLATDPHLRVLAAAAEAIERERAEEGQTDGT